MGEWLESPQCGKLLPALIFYGQQWLMCKPKIKRYERKQPLSGI